MDPTFAGIDLGGTSIKIAIGTRSGGVVCQTTTPTESHRGPGAVMQRIADSLESLLQQSGVERLSGIGVGVPGLVDSQAGVTRFLPNLPTRWRDVPLAATLEQRFAAPTGLLNDARTATLGELRFGHGKGSSKLTMAFFSIGTGVGGGIVVDGQLRLGPWGAAGELGHQTIAADGPRCGCGNRGCLEAIASGTAIAAEGVRLLRSGLAPALYERVGGDANGVNVQTMVQASDDEPTIREALERAARAIGIAAANVTTILHPDLIVLGGGVAEIGHPLLETVRRVVTERVGMFPTDAIRIKRSRFGDQAGVIGAIALGVEAADADSTIFRPRSH